MIRNNFKIAWRNLLKSKGYATINIIGLAIGMAAVLMIAIWVQNQSQFDNFYSNKDNLYRVWNKYEDVGQIGMSNITSGPASVTLKAEYPEVEHAARVYWNVDRLLSFDENKIKSKGTEVDPSFMEMFDFKLLKGNRSQVLSGPQNIILTESLSKKIFGDTDPLNKTLILDNKEPYQVSGIIADLPSNTDFDFNYLIPLTKADNYSPNWNTSTFMTYIQLKDGTDVDAFNKKLKNIIAKKTNNELKGSLFLYPLSKMHLYSKFEQGVPVGGKIDQVKLVAGLGFLILLIACINFVNLSTARSQKRAKEVAVRKVVGAQRSSLIAQFLTESVLLSFIAGILSIGLTFLALPFFNKILDKPLVFSITDPIIWVSLVGFILLTGVFAGLYPAFVLSSFKPIRSLKVFGKSKKLALNFREVLVVFQFGIALILIIATLIVRSQIEYAGKRDIGYSPSQLIEIPMEGDMTKNYKVIKSELINKNIAHAVTRTGWSITRNASNSSGNFSWEGATPEQGKKIVFNIGKAESDFVKTLGLKVLEGRDIDFERLASDSLSVLVNEAAIKEMKLKNPIGSILKWGSNTFTIVGVINDYINDSPYSPVTPLLIYPAKEWMLNMVVRTNPSLPIDHNLKQMEEILKKFNPAYPFEYKFVDQQFATKFKEQQQTAQLALIFSGLAIFISCLGLLGLASYIAELRTKEIGIRKVLGASVTGITAMLSRDFVKLVLIAILLASPIAWWTMNKWLEDFSYRIEIQWWIFAVAGIAALTIAILTVSTQAIRAANTNPVKTLRDE
ncbi:ABC transporter permease [Sphingobacterium faecium]|jgi:putative ABC transport system permease protein|uniref:ABC transporter permease n=1 Tax=Sphingobacterium faecium TaxID=34087 RepID=UPI00097F6B47|nr:ABC transporter permease [Sphingobacterium faecium]UXD68474.1 ABC transporter permease [Sphingobacterium faecium]WGQ16178.1 ABC transporter permease [Sphingobacterium faecium]SJN42779.1 putative ABC transporter permease [Sphingobacterium faecium PCAi_F2.5]